MLATNPLVISFTYIIHRFELSIDIPTVIRFSLQDPPSPKKDRMLTAVHPSYGGGGGHFKIEDVTDDPEVR